MELWPKNLREFRQRPFWKQFYERRSVDEITEWYGSIGDIKPVFQYELIDTEQGQAAAKTRPTSPQKKPTKNVSVLNCGFGASELAERLHDMMALRDVCTLLSSNEIVSFMQQRNEAKRPDLKFLALTKKLTDEVEAGTYDWIIDRGALDLALMSCEEKESNEVAQRHLDNALHVLRENGKLFLYTLAQDSVLKAVVQYFHSKKLTMRIYPISMRDVGPNANEFEPYCIVITKRPDTEAEHTRLTVDYRLADVKDRAATAKITIYQLFKFVKDDRRRMHTQAHLLTYRPGNLIFFEVVNSESEEKEPAYSMSVYDRSYPRFTSADKRLKFLRTLRPTIAILVPQADQHHWLYKTAHGHQRLCERAGCRRVICVFLPDFGVMAETQLTPAETVNKIKADVGKLLIELAVDKNSPVLLMTQQENFSDERIPVFRTESSFAGKVLVFDAVVDEDDEELKDMPEDDSAPGDPKPLKPSKYRRRTMIFQCNPRMAQTEIWYQLKDEKPEFDYLHVCHAYHLLMLAGLSPLVLADKLSSGINAAVLGLGGGMLAMLLRTLFSDRLTLTSIDIDPVVAEIAQEHFGYTTDDNSKLVVGDAADWVLSNTQDGSLDFIILDINSAHGEIGAGFEGVSCPPAVFLSEEFIKAVHRLLTPNGLLLINCVTHVERGRKKVAEVLKSVFQTVQILKYSEDLNRVIICRKDELRQGIPDLESESAPKLEDVRATLVKMGGSALPGIQRLINKTPMYLSKHARFSAQLESF